MRLVPALILGFILLLVFLIGIFLLIPFPLAIFQSIVNSQVYLQRKYDGQFPTGTYFWSRLPAVQYFQFYMWNVTNPDEVLYFGATPNLLEIGPYTYAETEFKDFIEFRNDDKEIFYQNNKTWVYDQSRSCVDCTYDDYVTQSNSAYMSIVFMQILQPNPPILQIGFDILTILTGEQPLRAVPVAGVLFSGYSDPLINLMNSQLTKILLNVLGNPVQLPEVVDGGFFPRYNHTCDGNYTLKTGKDKSENTALIQTWDGMTHLTWWRSEATRDLRNSGDGSFQKPNLQKKDRLKQFQSFTCRTYELGYSGTSGSVQGIPTYEFKVDEDSYDSIKYPGYQYENYEKVNYFPNWPCGPNHTKTDNGNCARVDCTLSDNFCNLCCAGSFVNNTYLMPPGIVPQRCLPGQNIPVPFGAFLSAPHFYGTPQVVTDSMIGVHPDESKHEPGTFQINPTTGSTMSASFRLQLTLPIFNSPQWTTMMNSPNSLLPAFWLDLSIEMRDYAIDYVYFNTVTIPNIILGIGIACVALSTIISLIWVFFHLRKRRTTKISSIRANPATGFDSVWETN